MYEDDMDLLCDLPKLSYGFSCKGSHEESRFSVNEQCLLVIATPLELAGI